MCGFLLIIALDRQPIPRACLERASKYLHHRGPDEEQIIIKENCGIVFRRLSINDLTTGSQPLWDCSNSKALICNGEIYNSPALRSEFVGTYSFRGNSDCEVILPLYEKYGEGCFEKLEGMFAGALFDFENKKLLVARDRFGIKPLYYYQKKGWLVVASEIKAMAATGIVERDINHDYIHDCFNFGYCIDQQTILNDVRQLAPASFAQYGFYEHKPIVFQTYWKPVFPKRQGVADLTLATEQSCLVREKLNNAIRSHLLSDVPLAAYLSGGLDSTITSLLMKKNMQSRLTTFSISFAEKDFDESSVFLKTVEYAGFDGNTVVCDERDIELFAHTIRTLEMPQFSPMDIPLVKLSKVVRALGIKVVLCGEGSDELFGGYPVFPWIHIASALNLPLASLAGKFLKRKALHFIGLPDVLHPVFLDVFSQESLAVEKELGFFPPWLPFWRRRRRRCAGIFNEPGRHSLSRHPALCALAEDLARDYPGVDRFDAAVYVELKTRLPNFILQRTDRTSMANSVEARVPFLDGPFADCAIKCPPLLKTSGFREKSILRRAFKDLLPPHFRSSRKFGYNAPNQWCWGESGRELVENYLGADRLRKSGIFNEKEIQRRIPGVRSHADANAWNLERHEDAVFLTGVLSTQILLEEFTKPISSP